MLKTLIIDNLALIDHVEFDFSSGLICFTGETGAGKSVFLSALKLLAGQRCERMTLRPGTDKCRIEGLFSFTQEQIHPINSLLTEYDIPLCEEGELIIRRSFGKQQRISVNGVLTSLLDRFAGVENQVQDFQSSFDEYAYLLHQLQTIEQEIQTAPGVIDFLKKQYESFNLIKLSSEYIEQLELDFKRLSQKETCLSIFQNIHNCLNDPHGLNETIDLLQNSLDLLHLHWPQAQSLVEQCQQVRLEIQDIENTCTHEQDNFDLDPEHCEQIQRNMQTWMELKHHYGPSLEQVIQAKKDLQAKLDRIENGETKIQEIRLKCYNLEKICREKAEQLHSQREQCIPKLTQLVVQCL